MKKNHLFLFLCFSVNLISQNNFNKENFIVTKADLEAKTFAKDPASKALVIYEYGNSYFDENTYNLKTEIKRKIKIFDKSETDETTRQITLYINDNKSAQEKVKNIKASTFNLINGKIVETKLSESQIYEDDYDKNHSTVTFTLPNVQNGSVITYSYTLDKPFIYKYSPWTFQDDIPVLYSEYNTSIFGNYNYNIRLISFKNLDIHENEVKKNCFDPRDGTPADCFIAKYVMTDIPAFKKEEYMTSKSNFISRIEYELKEIHQLDGTKDRITKTWKDTDKEWKINSNFGKQISKTNLGNDLLDESITSLTDPLQKAKAIYAFMQDNFKWNEKYQIFNDVSVKNLIKTKTGKVSEINILLNTLLNQNNIEAKPVILSTRSNGLITKLFPVQYDYNYLISEIVIDDKSYFLDATSPFLSFGELPFRCLNKYGRRIDFKNGSDWVDINAKNRSTSQHLVKLKINEQDNLITGNLSSRYFGYNAYPKKKSYFSHSTNSNYLETLNDKFENIKIENHTVKTTKKSDNSFLETFDFVLPELNIIGNKIYLDPFIFKQFKNNPFKLQERTYPVDFGYKDSYFYTLEIDLGDKYTVKEKPKNINVKLPTNGASCTFSSIIINNKLVISFKLIFNQTEYQTELYESIKDLMNYVVDIQTKTLIILEKK